MTGKVLAREDRSEWITCWHWTTRCRRQSIINLGLRRCSFLAGHLVLCVCTMRAAQGLRPWVGQRKSVMPDYLEGWMLRVHPGFARKHGNGVVTVSRDILPEDLIGPFPEFTAFDKNKHLWGEVQ